LTASSTIKGAVEGPGSGKGDPARSQRDQRRTAARSARAAQRRKRRIKSWLICSAVLLGSAGLALGGWALAWRTDLLAIKEVRIDGVEGRLREAVQQVAAVPVGTPLASLPSGAIQGRVSSLDWVARAQVRAHWPSAVVIEVEPRIGLGQDWTTGQLIDVDGVVFTMPGADPAGLPTVRASDSGRIQALRALQSLPSALAKRIDVVTASTRDDVRFTLDSGALVRWGSAEQGALKAEVLMALLARRALVYDVSSPLTPTTRGERRGSR